VITIAAEPVQLCGPGAGELRANAGATPAAPNDLAAPVHVVAPEDGTVRSGCAKPGGAADPFCVLTPRVAPPHDLTVGLGPSAEPVAHGQLERCLETDLLRAAVSAADDARSVIRSPVARRCPESGHWTRRLFSWFGPSLQRFPSHLPSRTYPRRPLTAMTQKRYNLTQKRY
jgi:hypothetical protein